MWWVGPSEQEQRDKGSRVKNVLKRGAWTGTASSRTIGQVHALGVRDSAVRDGVGIGGTQDTVYGWAGEGLGAADTENALLLLFFRRRRRRLKLLFRRRNLRPPEAREFSVDGV